MLHLALCFQKVQGPHLLTCIGKLWLMACSSKVWQAFASKVSTTLLGATFAVASDPGLLPLLAVAADLEECVESSSDGAADWRAEPSDSGTAALGNAFAVAAGSGLLPRPSSSSLSPAAEAAELLAEASGSDAPSLEALAATGGSGPRWASKEVPLASDSDSEAAAEVLAAPSPGSSSHGDAFSDAASGSDTTAHGDASSDSDAVAAATEALGLGEELAPALEDIAAGPRRGASGASRSS